MRLSIPLETIVRWGGGNNRVFDWVLRKYARLVYPSSDIPLTVTLGEGTRFVHRGIGVCVHFGAVIGKECQIMQNVTIGGRNRPGGPEIGDYCFIGAGACVLGKIKIGNNVMIGANAVVLKDVPDNAIVVGVPARIVGYVDEKLINVHKR